jgi:hypothetical protein
MERVTESRGFPTWRHPAGQSGPMPSSSHHGGFSLLGEAKKGWHETERAGRGALHVGLKVLASAVYAPYYAAHYYNKYTPQDPWGTHKLATGIQKASLWGDVQVDRLKRWTGVSPHEGKYDETPPGKKKGILEVHFRGEPQAYLPGYWTDREGRHHRDIEP